MNLVAVYGFSVGLCFVRMRAYLLLLLMMLSWSKEKERSVRIAVRTVCLLVGKYDEKSFFLMKVKRVNIMKT